MNSKEECDDELKTWLTQYPELLTIDNNKKILKTVMNWEI